MGMCMCVYVSSCVQLKAFLQMVSERANKAGQQAVAESKERMEREARLIKQYDEQKEVRCSVHTRYTCTS